MCSNGLSETVGTFCRPTNESSPLRLQIRILAIRLKSRKCLRIMCRKSMSRRSRHRNIRTQTIERLAPQAFRSLLSFRKCLRGRSRRNPILTQVMAADKRERRKGGRAFFSDFYFQSRKDLHRDDVDLGVGDLCPNGDDESGSSAGPSGANTAVRGYCSGRLCRRTCG